MPVPSKMSQGQLVGSIEAQKMHRPRTLRLQSQNLWQCSDRSPAADSIHLWTADKARSAAWRKWWREPGGSMA